MYVHVYILHIIIGTLESKKSTKINRGSLIAYTYYDVPKLMGLSTCVHEKIYCIINIHVHVHVQYIKCVQCTCERGI